MFPQLYVSMRIALEILVETQRNSFVIHRKYGAGGKVDADADHVVFVDARVFDGLRHGGFQRLQIVIRMLKRPVRLQARAERVP